MQANTARWGLLMFGCAVAMSGCITSAQLARLNKREQVLKHLQENLEGREKSLKLAESQTKEESLKLSKEWELVNVLFAARDLQPGEILSNDSVMLSSMPRRFVFESVLLPNDMEVALGRELLIPVKGGEPLNWWKLKGIRDLQRLSSLIRKGDRAVTISVTESSAVGLWVRPNDHIDVLYTSKKESTITLVEDVIVLSTGDRTGLSEPSRDKDSLYHTVTLLVSPKDAERLVLAQATGTLYLILRNNRDIITEQKEPRGATMRDLRFTPARRQVGILKQ